MSQMQLFASEKFLSISEILKEHLENLPGGDNLYHIEDYVRTLPEMIPEASKRDIIAKIIAAANLDKTTMMADGERRMEILREYAGNCSAATDAYVFSRLDEVDKLQERIDQLREEIKIRHEMQEKQITVINNEMQRLKKAISFLGGL